MKKGTTLGVVLSVICILALLGLGIFLMVDLKRGDQNTSDLLREGNVFQTEKDTTANSSDDRTAAALAAAEAAGSLPEHHVIFVGDSRTVGMGEAAEDTGDACMYIGATGEGYQWFVDSGLSQLEAAIDQYPDSPVVLNLGVNDMDRINDYLSLYESFSETWPERSFYYMSVNPVTEEAIHVTNEEIAAFNASLQTAFPDQYLDCNTYLKVQEFESVDGVHYSQDTYRMIHDFAVRQIFL